MGTFERSQPTLFDLGESERTTEQGAWPTPAQNDPGITVGRLVDKEGNAPSSWNQRLYDRQTGRLAQKGLTQAVQIGPSPSSPAATPASRSHTPGSDWARRMTAISGRRCAGSLTSPGPVSSWLKTLLGTSRWASTLFWLSWKRTDTPAGRLLYRLVPSTPSTGATGFGSWPTPTVDDMSNVTRQSGQFQSLTASVMQSRQSWPTPRHEGFDAGEHRGTNDSLHSAVKQTPFPTPRSATARQCRLESHHVAATPGKLHGRWTLCLMSFPDDWCDDLPPDPLGE